MKCIFPVIGRIYGNQFKCNDLRNKKNFPQLFTEFHKSTFNFKHFESKDESQSLSLPEVIGFEIRPYVYV